jgi:hypothetical protein
MLRGRGREEAMELDDVRLEALVRFTQQAGDEGERGDREDDPDREGAEATRERRSRHRVLGAIAERSGGPGRQRHHADHRRTRALHHGELTEPTPCPMPGDECPHAEGREQVDRQQDLRVAPGESRGGDRGADGQPRALTMRASIVRDHRDRCTCGARAEPDRHDRHDRHPECEPGAPEIAGDQEVPRDPDAEGGEEEGRGARWGL